MFSVLPAPDPDDPGIYLNSSPLPHELWRSVEIALIAATPSAPILFPAPADGKEKAAAWKTWTDTTFTQSIAPHLVRAHQAATLGVRELVEADLKFDGEVTDDATRERSRAMGLELLDRNAGARHLKPISKLQTLLETQACPGHAATVFALQCVLFHVPLAPSLVAYLFLEWQAAGGRDGISGFEHATPQLPFRLHHWVKSDGNNTFQPHALD